MSYCKVSKDPRLCSSRAWWPMAPYCCFWVTKRILIKNHMLGTLDFTSLFGALGSLQFFLRAQRWALESFKVLRREESCTHNKNHLIRSCFFIQVFCCCPGWVTKAPTFKRHGYKVEPQYNEGPRDWQNAFAIMRFRYIKVLFHIFHYDWVGEYCSLYRGLLY